MEQQEVKEPSRWRRLFGKDRFDFLLVLILIQLVVLSGFNHPAVLHLALWLPIFILFVAFRSSGINIRVRSFLLLWFGIFVILAGSSLALWYAMPSNPNALIYARIPAFAAAIIIDLLIIGMIVRRLIKHDRINLTTVFGALCIYLQIGLFFAALYGLIGAATLGQFFAGSTVDSQVIYVYYSYSCLTTVGFGDFVAAANLGRMLSVSEAIIGQLYLVGGVALIVGSLGKTRVDRK